MEGYALIRVDAVFLSVVAMVLHVTDDLVTRCCRTPMGVAYDGVWQSVCWVGIRASL